MFLVQGSAYDDGLLFDTAFAIGQGLVTEYQSLRCFVASNIDSNIDKQTEWIDWKWGAGDVRVNAFSAVDVFYFDTFCGYECMWRAGGGTHRDKLLIRL